MVIVIIFIELCVCVKKHIRLNSGFLYQEDTYSNVAENTFSLLRPLKHRLVDTDLHKKPKKIVMSTQTQHVSIKITLKLISNMYVWVRDG